jgi:hypothetical protein
MAKHLWNCIDEEAYRGFLYTCGAKMATESPKALPKRGCLTKKELAELNNFNKINETIHR